jgi:hypothetical protein
LVAVGACELHILLLVIAALRLCSHVIGRRRLTRQRLAAIRTLPTFALLELRVFEFALNPSHVYDPIKYHHAARRTMWITRPANSLGSGRVTRNAASVDSLSAILPRLVAFCRIAGLEELIERLHVVNVRVGLGILGVPQFVRHAIRAAQVTRCASVALGFLPVPQTQRPQAFEDYAVKLDAGHDAALRLLPGACDLRAAARASSLV